MLLPSAQLNNVAPQGTRRNLQVERIPGKVRSPSKHAHKQLTPVERLQSVPSPDPGDLASPEKVQNDYPQRYCIQDRNFRLSPHNNLNMNDPTNCKSYVEPPKALPAPVQHKAYTDTKKV